MSTSCSPRSGRPAGPFLELVPMLVLTVPGQSTETPTPEPSAASSADRTSDSATTPYLATAYEPILAGATRPAIDAVLTIQPPSGLARRIGRNACTPWMTPYRFTPRIQCQSSMVRSLIAAIGPMPALLQTTCTVP